MAVNSVQARGWTNPALTARFWAAMEDEQRREVARRVGRLQAREGWTDERFAQEAHLSGKTISRIKKAETENPRSETFDKLASAFKASREAITGPRLTVEDAERDAENQLDRIEKKIDRLLEREIQRELEEAVGKEEPPQTGTEEAGGE